MDNALAGFMGMKERYGDQFQLIVEDLHQEGSPTADGSKTAKIHIKVVVSPRNMEIEQRLSKLGLTYVEK